MTFDKFLKTAALSVVAALPFASIGAVAMAEGVFMPAVPPMVENIGIPAIAENGFEVRRQGGYAVPGAVKWIAPPATEPGAATVKGNRDRAVHDTAGPSVGVLGL